MTARDWAVSRLHDASQPAAALGTNGIYVPRQGRPDALGYCAEPNIMDPFTTDHFTQALTDIPDARMIIVFPRRHVITTEVYELARKHQICIDTFGAFHSAVIALDDISDYEHEDTRYIRRRLFATRTVTAIKRIGHRAWQIERTQPLRPLTIATHDRYEMTDEEFVGVICQYPALELDALVITNPNTRGFSTRVLASAAKAELPIYTFSDFLDRMRESWA